jgi:predicted O-methyltransferase YrrM
MVDKLYKMRNESYVIGLEDLIRHINKNTNTSDLSMIEIGSYAGESTEIFAKHFGLVTSIDPFINNYDPADIACKFIELEKVYYLFKETINKYNNIDHIRATSDDAIKSLKGKKYDFIYIDGLHTYEQIKADITNYLPLLKPNCFIGGHDYHKNWNGVVTGINELLGEPDLVFSDTSWIKFIK